MREERRTEGGTQSGRGGGAEGRRGRGAEGREQHNLVPTLCVGTHRRTLCVHRAAERPRNHSHAEPGNEVTLTSNL